jgi:hypothetical protein
MSLNITQIKGHRRAVDLGSMVLADSPYNFGELTANETENWSKGIRFAGIMAY